MGTESDPRMITVVVFRDPDDVEHSCHVGASQLREWSPVPERTLREVARVRDFIRHGLGRRHFTVLWDQPWGDVHVCRAQCYHAIPTEHFTATSTSDADAESTA